ncbi:MAG TPA: MmcQ/YjbR family DNA-binding protein [Dongiaceae bacterium]|nr:MmcQ/YjbR family DNA-binding protein [Dongiaceae bacterium]
MPCTPTDFRRMALRLPQTEERSHMNHPDFRVAGKIFCTLAYPSKEFGMVKLTAAQQADFVADHPAAFRAVPGAWGRKGCTHVILGKAGKRALQQALLAAWRNYAPKADVLASLKPKPAKKSRR